MTTPPTPAGAALDALQARYPAHWPAALKAQLQGVAEAYTAALRAEGALDAQRDQGRWGDPVLYGALRDANARYLALVRAVRPALRAVLTVQRVTAQHIALYCAIDLDALP